MSEQKTKKRARSPVNPDELIKKVKTDKKSQPIIRNPYYTQRLIPNHPFRLAVVGPSTAGKTTFVINLLTNRHFYRDFFDVVIVISPNVHDEQWDVVRSALKDRFHGFDDFNTDSKSKIDELIAHNQAVVIEEGMRFAPRMVIVWDDMVNDKKVVNSQTLADANTRGRHANCSNIFCAQFLNGFPLKLRKQLSNVIFFDSANEKEIKCLMEEFGHNKLSSHEFNKMVEYATKKQDPNEYPFLHINMQEPNKNERYRRKFQEVLEIVKE